MNTKKISELQKLESLSENTNVVVEDNGETKRFPAKNIGAVKTVNGASPDENGDVQIDVSWNGLPDKPFGEERETIVPETVAESDGDSTGVPQTVIPYTLKSGEKYIFVYNGVEKEVTAQTGMYDEVYIGFGVDNISQGSAYSVGFITGEDYGDSGDVILGRTVEAGDTFALYKNSVKTLDSKFIPKAARVSNVTEAPTAEQFNALLASLRAAGYLAN